MCISMIHSRESCGQRGFSLVELMVVVAVIGVLVSVAAVAMTTEPDVEDAAQKVAALVNEAARLAISGGPIDLTGAALANEEARGQLQVLGQVLTLEGYDEAALGFVERKRVNLGRNVSVAGWTPQGQLDPGTTPVVTPPFTFPKPAPFTKCKPDGTCTPMTLYLQDARRPDRKALVVVLQLNGMMTQVFSGW